jgi:DNA-binding response OmpR family regulator
VGATDYLTKPFGERELLLLLEKYLDREMYWKWQDSKKKDFSVVVNEKNWAHYRCDSPR